GSCRITTRLASQARRCDVSAETWLPPSSTDWPGCSGSASTWASTWTTTWYRSPGLPGSRPWWSADSASRAKASACCWQTGNVSAEPSAEALNGPLPFIQTLPGGSQGLQEQGAHLRLEPALQDHRAVWGVIHVQGSLRVAELRPPGLGPSIHAPPAS